MTDATTPGCGRAVRDPGRRDFIARTLGSGFAAAVPSVGAQAPHTSSQGLNGGATATIRVDTVDKMKSASNAGSPAVRASEIVVYPDVPHPLHADYRPSDRPQPKPDGWRRCLDGLRRNGVS